MLFLELRKHGKSACRRGGGSKKGTGKLLYPQVTTVRCNSLSSHDSCHVASLFKLLVPLPSKHMEKYFKYLVIYMKI